MSDKERGRGGERRGGGEEGRRGGGEEGRRGGGEEGRRGGGEEGRQWEEGRGGKGGRGTYLEWGQFMMTKLSTSSGCFCATVLREKRHTTFNLESGLASSYNCSCTLTSTMGVNNGRSLLL